ncbi:carboxymuconolactone decarboxylase family protein [Gynuella sunshinyii]|uniref:Carboxymuconolactone decarboxylase-like domain-containing protein n=1 Tax=Gynuella sunshinyii YC6258 TaxID=1445510 RepID=A0A0C5VDM5_9GAMM|nr:carboxymuconolactone decarboxylase family protein [Gynuella sunshinyii]AJQ92632.1 hypothetical protein YC6258_00582 [Gynuella sunshinyii YC6258]
MNDQSNLSRPLHYHTEIADIVARMVELQQVIDNHIQDTPLRHLAVLRASQINRCGFCVGMHSREARKDGESNQRLDHLMVWDQTADFSEAEKALLAWVEALTTIRQDTDYSALRETLRNHYSDQEICAYSAVIGMINFWNRMQISGH